MAKPYLKRGLWYVRVKDVLGWRSIAVPEPRTKAEANRHAEDLAMRLRRQRDGLEPMPGDRSFTLGIGSSGGSRVTRRACRPRTAGQRGACARTYAIPS